MAKPILACDVKTKKEQAHISSIGDRYGELCLIELNSNKVGQNTYHKFLCSCGRTKEIRTNRLGEYNDCGHKDHKIKDEVEYIINSVNSDKMIYQTHNQKGLNRTRKMDFLFVCKDCFMPVIKSGGFLANTDWIDCSNCGNAPVQENDRPMFYTLNGLEYIGCFGKDRYHKVLCPEGHTTYTLPYLVKAGFRCVDCEDNRTTLTLKEILRRVKEKGYQCKNLYSIKGEKYIRAECSAGHTWETRLNLFFREGRSCPECNKGFINERVFIYLQKIYDLGVCLGIKIGVTTNLPELRRRRQEKSSGFTHEIVFEKEVNYSLGILLEKAIKDFYPSKELGKVFDGYTEVFDPEYFLSIMDTLTHKDLEGIDDIKYQNLMILVSRVYFGILGDEIK